MAIVILAQTLNADWCNRENRTFTVDNVEIFENVFHELYRKAENAGLLHGHEIERNGEMITYSYRYDGNLFKQAYKEIV